MTFRPRRSCFAVALVALATGLACRAEQSTALRIGDAVPRALDDSSLLDVIRPFLEDGLEPRVELVRWIASAPDLGIGESEQASTFISDPSILAVVGHSGSKSTLLTKPMYEAAGMPLIVPTATARAIGDVNAGIFMLAPPDSVIGAFLVKEAINRLGARRIGIIHVADPYGDGIHGGVIESLRARGDSLVGAAALSGRECPDEGLAMDVIVRAFLQRARPDAVIIALPQRATWCAIRRLVREQPGILIIASDSYALSPGFPLTATERTNVHSLRFWEPGSDSLSQQFIARTRALLRHDPEPGDALTFDAFRLVAAAIREGNVTREAISNWLRQLGTPGHPAFQGITGPIDFRTPRASILHLKALADTVSRQ